MRTNVNMAKRKLLSPPARVSGDALKSPCDNKWDVGVQYEPADLLHGYCMVLYLTGMVAGNRKQARERTREVAHAPLQGTAFATSSSGMSQSPDGRK